MTALSNTDSTRSGAAGADKADRRPALAVYTHGELIGDAIVKLPFVRALRAAFPDWRIVWITTESSQLQYAVAPLIPGVIDHFIGGDGWAERFSDLFRPLPTDEHFALVIDTQGRWWRSLLARRLSHDVFVSGLSRYRFSDRKPAPERRACRHVLDRLFAMLEAAVGAPVPRLRMADCVAIPDGAAQEAAALLPAGPRYVALAPGAGKRVKCWPLERFIALAQQQEAAGRTPVFLLGPAEPDWLEPLRVAVPAALFPLQAPAADGGAQYTAVRTIAIARRCAAAAAADCGLANLLAAADIPLVSLFGPTNGAKLHHKVTAGVWLQAQDFGPGPEMTHIPLSAVADAVEKLLVKEGAS